MSKTNDELLMLTKQVRQISDEIASMKCRSNRMVAGAEKDQLREEIKMKQFQVLFYIEKMDNLLKEKPSN